LALIVSYLGRAFREMFVISLDGIITENEKPDADRKKNDQYDTPLQGDIGPGGLCGFPDLVCRLPAQKSYDRRG
jgi:hypothetical protein